MKTRTVSLVAVVFTSAFLSSTVAQAGSPSQTRLPEGAQSQLPGAQRFGTDPMKLLQLPKVQKELDLSAEQKEKLARIAAEVNEAAEKKSASVTKKEASTKDFEEFITQSREKVSGILNKKQLDRFKQIVLQVEGPAAFSDKEVAKQLKITPQQDEKLRGIADASEEKMRGAFERPRSSDPKEIEKVMSQNAMKLDEVFEQSKGDVTATLTPEQKAEFEKMRGATFELDRSDIEKQ